MMQYFEWYLPNTPHLWVLAKQQAKELAKQGISAVWLPPAYKGNGGSNDVGYGVYDLYDLGEFDQKGSIPTKYGTKKEYLAAVHALQKAGIDVYTDIVLNHKMGADETELVPAHMVKSDQREETCGAEEIIEAWTKFTFPGRNKTYSDFTWNWTHFDGIDYDNKKHQSAVYELYGKSWDKEVSKENGNYDYLMGADLDYSNEEVVNELMKWGSWYQKEVHMDGVRLDACKHIHFKFFKHWISHLRQNDPELFAVGEYWSANVEELLHYLDVNENCLSLFDVPLHMHFHEVSHANGNYDLSKLLEGTLVASRPQQAVTFVDNHDTQPSQSLSSWVLEWFKPLAYSILLLRRDGYPCVFYGDFYGIPHDQISPMNSWLSTLLQLRRTHAYGEQYDYFDDANVIGWTRAGDAGHPTCCAVIMSDSSGGTKRMYVGTAFSNQICYDALANRNDEVIIDEEGYGTFACEGGSVSVYVPRS